MTEYRVSDGVSETVVDAHNIETAMELAKVWLSGGDYLDPEDPVTVWVDATVTDGADTARVTVKFDPPEPRCTQEAHSWQQDYVHGHGPGVLVREYCCNCGAWRVTDTWAQRPDTGEQGLEKVCYEPADNRSMYLVAKSRVESDALHEYENILLADWSPDECGHYEWVATAGKDELIEWAKAVKDNE
jgi:hypothetical protein